VQVITFRSASEFAPYAFRAEGGGYYVHNYKSDYILIGDTGARDRELVAHEFTHMVVTQAGLKLPIWLNEGLADFYSTVEIQGSQAVIGKAPFRYMETLHRQKWIPWDALLAVDGNSQVYNQSGNLAILYSQSWALTHMLKFDTKYSVHFSQFLKAISDGQEAKQAFQNVYRKSMAAVDADLSAYLRGKDLPVSMINCKPEADPPAPVIADAADFEVQFALANVLASKPGTSADGQDRLARLSARYPDRPEPEEELGMLALMQNKKDDARSHLAVAVQRHSRDPEILYTAAVLDKEAGSKYGPVSALLRQALEIQPDMDKARLELGFLDYEDLQYKASLSLLSSLSVVPDDSRFDVYFTMAQCYVNLDDLPKAASYVKKAAQAATADDQKQQAADLLESVLRDEGTEAGSAASTPPKTEQPITNVRGMAKILNCSGGQKHLSVQVDTREMVFDIDNPDLVVRHPTADYSHWACGPLNAVELTVVYRPESDSGASRPPADGKAIELVF
jgi:tetratricopeptide (TPR) repeat protein